MRRKKMKGGKCLVNVFNRQTYSIKPDKSMDDFENKLDERQKGYLKDPNESGKKKCVFYTKGDNLIVELENGDTIVGDMASDMVSVSPNGIYITHDEQDFDENDYDKSEPVECIRMQSNAGNLLSNSLQAATSTAIGAQAGSALGTMLMGGLVLCGRRERGGGSMAPLILGGLGALGAGSLISGMIYYVHHAIVINSFNKKSGNYYMTVVQEGGVGGGEGGLYKELVVEWRIYYNFDEMITDTQVKNLLESFHVIDKREIVKKRTMGYYREIVDQISTESIYNPTPGPKQLSSMKESRKFDPSARYHNCVTVTNYILDLLTKEIRASTKKKKKKKRQTRKKKKKRKEK